MVKSRKRNQGYSSGLGRWLNRALLTILFIVITYVCSVLRVQAGDDDDFDVEANGRVTDGGSTATVVVTITNNGKDFGGYVRLNVYEKYSSSEKQNAYECYISVAEDETENITISFPVMEGMDLESANVDMTILNEKKQLVQIEKLYHLFDNSSSAQIGLLCNDPKQLDFLSRFPYSAYVYMGYGNNQQWESEALMPSDLTDGITLATMTMLVIDDFDSSSLKKDEIAAIQSWVKSGGILLIGTGENGDTAFRGFDDKFIEASLGSLQPYQDYSYFAENGYIMFSDINYGSSYQTGLGRDAQMKTEGRGVIILTQFALTDPELDKDYYVEELFRLTSVYFNASNAKRYTFSQNELGTLFGVMQGKASLNAKLLGSIIVIYVILVGPVLYLVLRKYDKREKIWYAVPIMSLIFVFIVFLASRGFSIRNRMFETIRVARADGSGMEADYIFGFASNQKQWSISLDHSVETVGPLILTDPINSLKDNEYKCLASRSPKGVQVSYRPKGVFESAYLKSLQPNPDEYGDIIFDMELKRSGISGTIDNDTDYDFDYVLAVCDGYYQIIPNLESGDSYTLSGNGRSGFSNESVLLDLAKRTYAHEDYAAAKQYAALAMAAHELQGESRFVIGITSSKDKVLQGLGNSEESFLCIYQAE